jgi:hypothetical protein
LRHHQNHRRLVMKKITIVVTMIAMAVLTAGSIAADTEAVDDDPPGRIVAARGNLDTLAGTLRWERDEWYLGIADGRLYELHLGPYGHRDEPIFTAGTSATTEGFVYGTHIAPITVETAGTTHRFWSSDRMPMWAGSGEGGGRVAWDDDAVPQGQRLAVQDDEEVRGLQAGPRALADRRFGDGVQRAPGAPGTPGEAPREIERGFRNDPPGAGRFRD